MSNVIMIAGLASVLALTSCYKGVDSPRGFSLPKGDFELGRQVFVRELSKIGLKAQLFY